MGNIVQDVFCVVTLIICVVSALKNSNVDEVEESKVEGRYSRILLILILLIFVVSVGYKLGEIPQGLHVDEAGAMYDAICISKYGVDRYLYKLPVYLINFGGGQSALYAYLAGIMMKIFGTNFVAFRLPAVILSFLAIVSLYKLVEENYGKIQALIASFLLAICPWHILKSRWGLDANLMSPMLIISLYFFIKAIKAQKSYLYVISGILWGLTLYTYVISYLVIPIILAIVLGYLLLIKKVSIKNIILMGIPLAILAFPLILMVAYNNGTLQNADIPIFSIPKLWFFRGGEISLKNVPDNLQNIVDILFTKDFLNYNSIEQYGTVYKMGIPLVIFGLIEAISETIKSIKNRKFTADFVMSVTFFVILGVGLCLAELNINKLNAIYIPMIYFAGKCLSHIFKNLRYGAVVILVLYIINYAMFMQYYFTDFANTNLQLFENDIITASQKAEEFSSEKIYVEDCLNQTYIYTLIANPISPYEFNENLQINYGAVLSNGKYYFEIPSQIEEDAVYIVKSEEIKGKLLQNGFSEEKFGEFSVFVK